MRSFITAFVAACILHWGSTGRADGDTLAQIVATTLVWDRANHVTDPDLIRFGDRWLLVCQENVAAGWPGGAVRVLTSTDGTAWESAALIESPTANRGLYSPTFTLTPEGRLMVSAMGFVGWPNPTDPVSESGGTLKSMAWVSKDGRDWGKPALIGLNDFPLGRIAWRDGTAFSYAIGRICGSVKTVHIMTSKDGLKFESLSEEYLEKMLPYEGELLFDGDTAYCLMTGGYSKALPGLLGTAKAPYKDWKWKVQEQPVRHPKFIRRPGKGVIATVGLFDGKTRTSLCEFNPANGKFTELLELPTGEQAVTTGLAWYDGHVWVSYPVVEGDKQRLHLSKLKLR